MIVDIRTPQDRKQCGRFRVVVNGQDVTDRCFYLDTELRMVGLYLRNERGHFYIDHRNPLQAAQEWLEGVDLTLIDTTTAAHRPPADQSAREFWQVDIDGTRKTVE